MKVEITRVLDNPKGWVAFRCALGSAFACWMGPTPARRGEFDVEIEIPEEVADLAIVDDAPRGSIMGFTEGKGPISISGTVVEIGEGDDPIVGLRLGSDIVLIEAPDRKWEIAPGDVISLNVSSIQLYPYDL
ncbi:hypothetical protein [Kitasatospora sp. NPDC091276]|uniref:hypothetical protein n=1 Tax=unclassified Kitasatospora TaxID=2633591 RepID=UPI003415E410